MVSTKDAISSRVPIHEVAPVAESSLAKYRTGWKSYKIEKRSKSLDGKKLQNSQKYGKHT